MMICKQQPHPTLRLLACYAILAIVLAGCAGRVYNIRNSAPFVTKNEIKVVGKLPAELRQQIETTLPNYWDDSLRANWKNQLLGKKMEAPVPYDSSYLEKTKFNFTNYLNSLGFYNVQFEPMYDSAWTKPEPRKKQNRVKVGIVVKTGKNFTIKSVDYGIEDSALQALTLANLTNSNIKANTPYTKQAITSELDRLVSVYRNNGYLKISREDFYASVDTTVAELRDPEIDPIDLVDAIRRQREDPKLSIRFHRDTIADASHFRKYYIGTTTIYPEVRIGESPDSVMKDASLHVFPTAADQARVLEKIKDSAQRQLDTIKYHFGTFKYSALHRNNYLKQGDLYREQNLVKTQTSFNSMGVWQQNDVRITAVADNDSVVNFHLFYMPGLRRAYGFNFEGSNNSLSVLQSGSNSPNTLLGFSVGFNYTDRNLWQQAIRFNSSVKAGIEIGFGGNQQNFIQSLFAGFDNSLSLPRLLVPFESWRKVDAGRTQLNAGISYRQQFNYFVLQSYAAALSWEWKKGNWNWQVKVPGVEINKLQKLDSLLELIKRNPLLAYSFIEGNITNAGISFTHVFPHRKTNLSTSFRASFEESGAVFGTVLKIIPDVIKYIKFDADFRHVRRYRRSEVAFRVYGGYAYRYGGANREENATLPFFKQFFSGGPNNMRGWNLRSLGLGRDTTSYNSPNHLGDIQLEGNAEYRFKIGNVLKGTLNGGLFCDIGNIWSRYEIDPTKPSESAFKLSRLWQDLAISPGFGLRYDFNSIIIRIDCGFKLKDPARGREANSDGWMSGFTWEEQAFPSDPGRAAITRSNYAIQFAVGLPF